MTEHHLNNESKVHPCPAILSTGDTNEATPLQRGLRNIGVHSSLNYPAGLKVSRKIRSLQQDSSQPLTSNISGLNKLQRKISRRMIAKFSKRRVGADDPGLEIFTSPQGAPWPLAKVEPKPNDIIHLQGYHVHRLRQLFPITAQEPTGNLETSSHELFHRWLPLHHVM